MRRWGSARNGELFIIITILILRKWLGQNYFSQNTCKIYTDKGFILFNSSLGRGFDIRSSQNPGIAKISFSLIVIIWSYGHHNNNHRCAGCLIRRAQFGQSKFGESYLDSQNLESRPMAEKKGARSGRPTGSFCSATDLIKFIITKVTYCPLSTVSIKLYRLW